MEIFFKVAVKALIKNDEGQWLVLFRSANEEINPSEIDIPGGGMNFGEKAEESLHREIMEEVGIEIEIEKPLRVWNFIKNDLHVVGITFLAKYVSGEIKLSGEHSAYKWISKDEIMIGDYPQWIKEEFGNV